jgi:para-nitrobenzyl esterase
MCEAAVPQGAMRGKLEGKTCEYYGIRYGAPPVGALRFAPPQAAGAWKGTLNAANPGQTCIQGASVPGLGATGAAGEDCLFLNVFTPQSAPAAPLPVMVFIHGGGFSTGAGSPYDAKGLSETGPVVVVTLNYRLGALGYLALPELDATRPGTPAGSDGIRDQQLALRWVKDHVGAFHGDPDDITVFGESAGSISTSIHLVSPGSQGIARRYIMQSLVCIGPASFVGTQSDRYALSEQLAASICPRQDGGAGTLDCLRKADPSAIMAWAPTGTAAPGSFESLTAGALGAPFNPIVEGPGGVLPDQPVNLIKGGHYDKNAEIVAGTTKNEFGLYPYLGGLAQRLGIPGPTQVVVHDVAGLDQGLQTVFPTYYTEVEGQYPATDATAQQVLIDIVTDYAFRCPTRNFARLTTASGTRSFYLYAYDYGRAYHSDDLLAVFDVAGLSFLGGTVPTPAFSSAVKGYWTRMAASGDPNGAGAPSWPKFDATTDGHIVLVDPPMSGAHLAQANCDFWDKMPGYAGYTP